MSLEQLQIEEQTPAPPTIAAPQQEQREETIAAPPRANLRERIRQFRRGAAFPAWVSLGLIAAAVGVSLLELIANLFGRMRLSATPGLAAIVVYMALAVAQPRLFPWPRRRLLYLALIFLLTLTLALVVPLPLRPGLYIAVYGIVAHARMAFKKRAGLLIEAMVVAGILLGMILTGGTTLGALGLLPLHYPPRDLLEFAARNGVSFQQASVGLQFTIWLVGFLFVHAFTGLGVHERSARLKSEQLVSELTETQEQLRAYALRAEELATMRERERVAREIHDTLAQGLAAIKMHLETGSLVFPDQPDLAHLHMQRASDLAGEYLREARTSILQLRANALDGQTLPQALAALAAAWQPDEHDGEAVFTINGIDADDPFWQTIPPALALACYRVAQEALTNARKHARARRVDIELSVESGELCLTITDDGGGFDPALAPSTASDTGGFGITGMRERVKLLNGRLEVISAPEAGTQVAAMIPLVAAQFIAPVTRDEPLALAQ